MRFVRGFHLRQRGADPAPPRSDYLWNPADPRSFQALRESGGAVVAAPRPRTQRPVSRDDATVERLQPLEPAPGSGIGRGPRRRVVAVAGACGAVVVALIVVAVAAPDDVPAGVAGPAASGADPDAVSQDQTTAGAPADRAVQTPAATAAEAEAQYLQTVRDVSWKVRGQLESIFEEGLRDPGPGRWHWARRDDRVFARPLAHGRTALQDGLDVLAAVTPPDAFAADHAVLQAHYAAAIDLSPDRPADGRGAGPARPSCWPE